MSGALATAAGWLPAIFWVFYTLWNTALTEPPSLGPLTPINALYLLMLPATLVMALRWRELQPGGARAYLAFLVWLVMGILWHYGAPSTTQIKAVIVCALAFPIAAQLVIARPRAQTTLATGITLTSTIVSLWMIGQALASGFQYRTGTLLNQNFVATMVAPGLLIALAFYLARQGSGRLRAVLLTVVLMCIYASLLLGSRGVLIAEVVAIGALVWQVRPSLRQTRGLLAGTAVVIVMAQMPMIPNALWRTGWWAVETVQAAVMRVGQPAPPATAAAPTNAPGSTSPLAAAAPRPAPIAPAEPAIANRPLDPRAAQSTALSRFVEKDTDTLNLRSSLWRATIAYAFSGPITLLAGGGLGVSGEVAYRANPVFHNAHNTYLQLLDDTGVIGLAILTWLFWTMFRALAAGTNPVAHAWIAVLAFWLVAGLTSTVIDLHVFWVCVGAAMAAARDVTA